MFKKIQTVDYGPHVIIGNKVIGFTANCNWTPIDYLSNTNKQTKPLKVPKGFLELLFREDRLMQFIYENDFTIFGLKLKTDIVENDI